MIEVKETTDHDLIKEILSEPVLFKSTSGLMKIEDLTIDPKATYLVVMNDDQIVGCIRIREMTKLVLEVHPSVCAIHWGTGLSEDISQASYRWFQDQGYKKIFTTIPSVCQHALKRAQLNGYKACGMIEKGVVYHNVLCTLFFYELDLTEQ